MDVQLVPSADRAPTTYLPSELDTATVSRVPFAAFTTTGSSTDAPVAASPGVMVITAMLTGAELDEAAVRAISPGEVGGAVVGVGPVVERSGSAGGQSSARGEDRGNQDR